MDTLISFIPILIFIFISAFILFVLATWIWMLVDCAANPSMESTEKLMWVIIIIFAGWIGALIYFFIQRPKKNKARITDQNKKEQPL